jgi:ribonuclease P/MRP protein subunit POP5
MEAVFIKVCFGPLAIFKLRKQNDFMVSAMPSYRDKKRYVIFRIHSEEPLDFSEIKNSIMNSVFDWLGEEQAAKSGMKIIRNLWDEKAQTGFIRCSPKYVDKIKVSLALIHQIGDSRVVFQTLRVSGTIKSGSSAKPDTV